MVTRGEDYVEKGIDTYEKRRIDRTFTHLKRKARHLGYQLVQTVENGKVANAVESVA